MIEKSEIYNKINNRAYLKFELNENNEKEYLEKLISVQKALKDVEQKNKEAYQNKVQKIENLKKEIKEYYNYLDDIKQDEKDILEELNKYIEKYVKPLEQLYTRKEKLQLQVVPYITNGIFQRFKAIFSYEGRSKLKIEKQFNKELKLVSKEIKELECKKNKNPFEINENENFTKKYIIEKIDLEKINENLFFTQEQINEFKQSIRIAKDVSINSKRNNFVNDILDYIEICTDYVQIVDLNIEEHYKFKNTEYKLYLKSGYLDNDVNSIVKYLEIIKCEKDFVEEQAANKLIEGIQECILDLEQIVNNEEIKLA